MTISVTRPAATGPARLAAHPPLVTSEATLWAVDLDVVDVPALRRVVLHALGPTSRWGQVVRLRDGRRRPVKPSEALLWVDQVVSTAGAVDGDLSRAHALGSAPLGRRPLSVVVAPDAVVLRWQRGLGGPRDAQLLLHRLVRAATGVQALAPRPRSA